VYIESLDIMTAMFLYFGFGTDDI